MVMSGTSCAILLCSSRALAGTNIGSTKARTVHILIGELSHCFGVRDNHEFWIHKGIALRCL